MRLSASFRPAAHQGRNFPRHVVYSGELSASAECIGDFLTPSSILPEPEHPRASGCLVVTESEVASQICRCRTAVRKRVAEVLLRGSHRPGEHSVKAEAELVVNQS